MQHYNISEATDAASALSDRVHGAACACCVRRRGALRSGACRNAPIPHATEAQGTFPRRARRPCRAWARAQTRANCRASRSRSRSWASAREGRSSPRSWSARPRPRARRRGAPSRSWRRRPSRRARPGRASPWRGRSCPRRRDREPVRFHARVGHRGGRREGRRPGERRTDRDTRDIPRPWPEARSQLRRDERSQSLVLAARRLPSPAERAGLRGRIRALRGQRGRRRGALALPRPQDGALRADPASRAERRPHRRGVGPSRPQARLGEQAHLRSRAHPEHALRSHQPPLRRGADEGAAQQFRRRARRQRRRRRGADLSRRRRPLPRWRGALSARLRGLRPEEMGGRGRLCRADAVRAVPEERLDLGSLELPSQRPHRRQPRRARGGGCRVQRGGRRGARRGRRAAGGGAAGAAATAIRPGVRSARAQGSRQLRASSAPAQGRLRVLEDVDMLSRRVFLVLACFAAAVCAWPAEAPAQSKLKVVASFSILGDLVHQIGGDRVEVTTLVGPNGDAHAYSPTPADSAKIQQADLVAINGISFEMWADRLVKAASYKGARLVASRGIRALRAGGRPDPHAWQDVQNVKLYVANIRDALIGIDPAGAADYQARATAYLAELDELDAEIKKAFEAIPKARRKAITSHDAFTYFGDAYGVVFHSPQGISTDAAASSRGVAALIKQIKAEGIRAVFVENMTNQRIIEQIAKETGVKIGGTLYSDALSSGPPADTYIDLMRHNTRLLAAAMQ